MDVKKPVFKCVPFDSRWSTSVFKPELKAIYRRPRRITGEFDEVTHAVGDDGRPLWDLTGPLPVKRHSDWIAKGFEYVTLADKQSLADASGTLRENGFDPRDYLQHPQLGPWNPKLYLASESDMDRVATEAVLTQIRAFGVEAYEGITGKKVPENIRRILEAEKGDTVTASTVTSAEASAVSMASGAVAMTGHGESATVAPKADTAKAARAPQTRKRRAPAAKPAPAGASTS